MEPPGGRDSRFNLGYSMNLLSGETAPEIYGNPSLGRPSTSLQQLSPRHTMVSSACGGRGLKSDMYDERGMSSQSMGLEACGVNDINEDTYSSLQAKKSPPSNGKKTKGRVKIKMEYIENKLRRYTTFSKRKTGIMKKAYELSTLTGTQVMLLVASETGHVYTFATRKLQPMITSEAGKALIQTCLNSPDPPAGSAGGDQRMSATGFEETELTYNISDEDSKDIEEGTVCTSSTSSDDDEEVAEDNSEPKNKLPAQPPPIPKDWACSNNKTSQSNQPKKFKGDDKGKIDHSSIDMTAIRKETQPGFVLPLQCQLPNEVINTTPSSSSVPIFTSNTLPSSTISTNLIPPAITTAQMQAVPLLLQTSAGLGFATTSGGMILGMLQGPSISQPQFVAIPMPGVTTTTTTSQNSLKETGDNNSC